MFLFDNKPCNFIISRYLVHCSQVFPVHLKIDNLVLTAGYNTEQEEENRRHVRRMQTKCVRQVFHLTDMNACLQIEHMRAK